MGMDKYQKFGQIAEKIVHDLLNNGKNKVDTLHNKGPGYHGDYKVRKKVIEVKGYWTDEDTDNDKDFPTKSISISSAEWEMVKKNPKNFVLWVVYRLDRNHKVNKGYPARYAVMPGEVLKKCKGRRSQSVNVRIPEEIWHDPRVTQMDIPKHLKKKYELNKNEK